MRTDTLHVQFLARSLVKNLGKTNKKSDNETFGFAIIGQCTSLLRRGHFIFLRVPPIFSFRVFFFAFPLSTEGASAEERDPLRRCTGMAYVL